MAGPEGVGRRGIWCGREYGIVAYAEHPTYVLQGPTGATVSVAASLVELVPEGPLTVAEELRKLARIGSAPSGVLSPAELEWYNNHPLIALTYDSVNGDEVWSDIADWLEQKEE